ncbi:MAG: diguanylate cyclase [Spirochaetaceae bacterium]|nr:MAG: diguanylate cyclase [Spirochaetaceae bacterium]
MSRANDIGSFLQNVAIFADLSSEERSRIAALLSRVELKGGQQLFREGDRGETLYIVRSGECAITVSLPDGQEIDITSFGSGDFFGEMSVFEDAPRSASCYARSDAVLYALTEHDFHTLLDNHPSLAMQVMFRMLTATAQRLANTNVFLSDMVQWGEAARKRAVTDEATGLFNRRFLDEAIEEQFQKARTANRFLSVVMLDLDHFNSINDQYGHPVGDEVIKEAVSVFRRHFRDSDIVARYGGDEFTILMPDTGPALALEICSAVCRDVAALSILEGRGGSMSRVTTSQGIASYPHHGTTVEQVKERADQALYRAKEKGRNQALVAEGANPAAHAAAGSMIAKHDIPTIAEKNRVVNNIIDALVSRKRFLVIGHQNPDEDCISSMVSIGLLLSKLAKPVLLCTAPEIPVHFRYLLEICRYNSIDVNTRCDGVDEAVDTLIICDSAKPSMIESNPTIDQLMADPRILKIEIDHHLDTDSRYSGDEGFCLVAAASSAAELIGYLGCKLSLRRDVIREYDIDEVFSRNMVLAVLTGIVGDTQMGKFIKSKKERRFYNIFSGMFNRLLSQKTTKQSNFYNMEQVYSELRSLSASQKELYTELFERRTRSDSVAYIALDARESQGVYSRFDIDTVVSVARAIADELAEESGKLSLVAYYDHTNSSDLVQFRMRRSESFKELDLRSMLSELNLKNGGGHEGAIGFRVPKGELEDFSAFVTQLIETAEARVAAAEKREN